MQRVPLIALVVVIGSMQLTKVTCNTLECTRLQTKSLKYLQNCNNEEVSCCDIANSHESGDGSSQQLNSNIYSIKRGSYSTSAAYCDMTTDGGGWIVILRRAGPTESFEKYYHEYEAGFGQLDGDFFYGLRAVQELTAEDTWEMRIDFYDRSKDEVNSVYAVYDDFMLGSKEAGYTLHLGSFSSSDATLLDNLRAFDQQKFVARRPKEGGSRHPCVVTSNRGGWWYTNTTCQPNAASVLTLPYWNLGWYDRKSDTLERWYGKYEMKIRKINCLRNI